MDEKQLSKIKWHCRRGTKELDIMLTRFVDAKINELDEDQLHDFKRLLKTQDPQLEDWLFNKLTVEDKGLSYIVRLIQTSNNM